VLANTLNDITWDPLSEGAHLQARLPVKRGGAGLSNASDTAAPAFLASVAATWELQSPCCKEPPAEVDNTVATLNVKIGAEDVEEGRGQLETADDWAAEVKEQPQSLTSPRRVTWEWLMEQHPTQHTLMQGVYKAMYLHRKQTGSDIVKAVLLSASMKHSGAWLDGLSSGATKMEHREFTIALRLRLAEPVYGVSSRIRGCPQCKEEVCSRLGHHSLSCRATGDRAARHNNLRDLAAQIAKNAALSVVVEHRHLLAGHGEKPGDFTIANWEAQGRTGTFDVAAVSPVLSTLLPESSVRRGHAAKKAEDTKDNKSYAVCLENGFDFIPLAVEFFGGWGRIALQELRKIATMASERGRSRSQEI